MAAPTSVNQRSGNSTGSTRLSRMVLKTLIATSAALGVIILALYAAVSWANSQPADFQQTPLVEFSPSRLEPLPAVRSVDSRFEQTAQLGNPDPMKFSPSLNADVVPTGLPQPPAPPQLRLVQLAKKHPPSRAS